MVDDVGKGGFDFYLRFVKPLVINLPDTTDRVLAAAWVQKLRNDKSNNEEQRTNYLKLLLFVLQRKRLIGPFRENPNTQELEKFPANIQIVDVAKSLLQADEVDRRERLRGLIAGGGDDFPPYNIECSADLLEYTAAQDIPKFGVHAYYALSNSPITTWENVDISYLPKGVNLDKGVESGGINVGATASSPEILNKSHLSVSDSRSKSRSRSPKGGDKSSGKSSKRAHTKGASLAKSPLGSAAPVEDRSPPTWGSNLIEVTDPPDDTAFNLALSSGANYGDLDLMADELDLDASSHADITPRDQSVGGEPDWFHSPTDKFVEQFNNISIRPGTAKSRDIIDEVNQALLQSGRDISLSQAEAELDARYPHRRKDMPKTPPKFSKHERVRKAGQGLQYSPEQFGLNEEEDFLHGPSFIEGHKYSPKNTSNTRTNLKQGRMFTTAFKHIDGNVSLHEDTAEFLVDDIDDGEAAIRTPKNVKKKLKELLNEIEVMKETTPALGGVPVTTPKRSPTPGRKVLSPDFNLQDQFALFTEAFPSSLETEYMDASTEESPHKKSPHVSVDRPGSPAGQMLGSPRTPSPRQVIESPRSRAARLRPESPPTPEKPGYEEFMNKISGARKFLRPQKIELVPSLTSKKIKVYSKPVKHYKPPGTLNKIEESPEYKKTTEERYYDLYEKLIAEDMPGDAPMSPPAPSKLLPAFNLSPLSPRSPTIDWAEDLPDISQDINDDDELYESPKRISPLQELNVCEQGVDVAPDIMENIQFNFDYDPIDLGATTKTQNLYEGEVYAPTSPRTPPCMTNAEIANLLGTPRDSPVRHKTRPRPSPIPSPQFYEMENVLTPAEFQQVMAAHEYTEMHVSRDPDRRLASQLRTPYGAREIPLQRHAPKPKLPTIPDQPILEDILVQRERDHPTTPPSPLTPGAPWRRPRIQGNIRLDEMSEEVQQKLMEPVPQRELKEWEQNVFDAVIKPEDADYFIKLFNEYNITKDELINPEIIDRRALREPRQPARPLTVPESPPPPMVDAQLELQEDFFQPKMRVVPPPNVELRPGDIPDSWAVTENLLAQANMARDEREWKEKRVDDFEILETEAPLIDDSEFTFESPRKRAARFRPYSPPTPEKPTYEELIANAKAAKKTRRPSKMTMGTPSGTCRTYYTRPLRHYAPLEYLDRIDESPYVSPEIDWAKIREAVAREYKYGPEYPDTTPQIQQPQRRRRGRSRIPEEGGMKPKKLQFSGSYFSEDSSIPEEDRIHYNKLLATLPELPPQPLPEELMGEYYEQDFPEQTCIIDKNIPAKHAQHQRSPMSPERENIYFSKSPATPPVSPIKVQTMFADPLNQEMAMNFPEDIEGEIEPVPDPYAFMNKLPTRLEGFQDDLIPAVVGTEHEGFTDSPDRPSQQPKGPCMPCTSTSPKGHVTPGSPFGLDTFFQTPPAREIFERYPDEDTHEMWMEYQPVEYFEADQYKMDTPPKPKSPPRPKSPPKPRTPSPAHKAPSPKPESPLPIFETTQERNKYMQGYTTSPSPFKDSPYYRTPPHPKHKYVLTPTRPSPYKESHTPPGTPPAYAALEVSPIKFAPDIEPYLYLASPEYLNENVDDGQLEDFDLSYGSSGSAPDQGASPTHLTATPPPRHQTPVKDSPFTTTPQVSPQLPYSPLPSPTPISQNVGHWEQGAYEEDFLDVTAEENYDKSPVDIYESPVCSPERPCTGSPPTPPQPWAHENQFSSPTPDEFQAMMAAHEYTEHHVSRDPRRKLATKVLRTTTGNRGFHLPRHAPRPTLPTIYDFDETPEHVEVIQAQAPQLPPDLIWQSPEPNVRVPTVVPTKYDTGGYVASPEQEFQSNFINMLPKRKEVRRNLFDEYGEDSEIQECGVQNFTPPALSKEAWFQSPQTPPTAFSPTMHQRMQRSLYDGSAPYANYPDFHTPPSGSRRRKRTYTPPGPPVRSPIKPTREEMMQNIATCYAPEMPHSMGVHSRTGYIKNVPTRPVQEYYSKRMDRLEEVGEQYLTPPSGLKKHRRTYTPHATPRASPRLSPDKPVSYTPTPIPSPANIWFKPSHTPPLHLRWPPLPITPSPPKSAAAATARAPVRRQLFADTTPRTPRSGQHPSPSPELSFATPTCPGFPQQSSDDDDDLDEFATPEGSPRTYMFEQEIVYNIDNAFANAQNESILDTSDIPNVENDDALNFQWMG